MSLAGRHRSAASRNRSAVEGAAPYECQFGDRTLRIEADRTLFRRSAASGSADRQAPENDVTSGPSHSARTISGGSGFPNFRGDDHERAGAVPATRRQGGLARPVQGLHRVLRDDGARGRDRDEVAPHDARASPIGTSAWWPSTTRMRRSAWRMCCSTARPGRRAGTATLRTCSSIRPGARPVPAAP